MHEGEKENEKENCISIISLCTWNVPGDRMWKQCKGCRNDKDGRWKIQLDLWYSGGKTAVNVFQDIVDAFNESQDKYEVKTTTQADYTETYENCRQGLQERKLRTWHFWIQINPEIFLKKSGCRHQ